MTRRKWLQYCEKLIAKGVKPEVAVQYVRYLYHYEKFLKVKRRYS